MRFWKYMLWTGTLVVVSWALTIISCVVGGKGIGKKEAT